MDFHDFEKKKRDELHRRRKKLRDRFKITMNKDAYTLANPYLEKAEHDMTVETQNEIIIDLLTRIWCDIPESIAHE